MQFTVKTKRVIHETFDDEVVIVDLDSGSYYSLNAAAADLWGLIEQPGGSTLAQMTRHILSRYEGSAEEVQNGVERFLQELQNENLVAAIAGEYSAVSASEPTAVFASLPRFAAPELSKYTDMQELLLMDVIHDVDETGWPNAAQKVAVEPGVR